MAENTSNMPFSHNHFPNDGDRRNGGGRNNFGGRRNTRRGPGSRPKGGKGRSRRDGRNWDNSGGRIEDQRRFGNDRFGDNNRGYRNYDRSAGYNDQQQFNQQANSNESFPKFKDSEDFKNSSRIEPNTHFNFSDRRRSSMNFANESTHLANNQDELQGTNSQTTLENQQGNQVSPTVATPPSQEIPKELFIPIPLSKIKVEKTNNDKEIKATKKQQTESEADSDTDSDDTTVRDLKNAVLNKSVVKTESSKTVKTPPPKFKSQNIKKEPKQPSSSSDTSSSSEDEHDTVQKPDSKHKSRIEEEVICLGQSQHQQVEDLVDEDSNCSNENSDSPFCLLCDKEGHTSMDCQKICKNCNEPYHSFRHCPKPANMSIVMQHFMQFCMNQCYKYNPDKRFDGKENAHITPTFVPAAVSLQEVQDHNSSINSSKRKKSKTSSKGGTSSPVPSTASKLARRKQCSSSGSESSSDEGKSKRKKSKKSQESNLQLGQIPFGNNFAAASMPFGFSNQNPMLNQMLALSQMMGFNPAMGFGGSNVK